MNKAPTEQGFYTLDTDGWEMAVSVPSDHLIYHSKYVILRRDFAYVDKRGGVHIATIGFPFDGLSIPRILWRIAGNPFGTNLAAGVIHDVLCALANSRPPGKERDQIRAGADSLFAEMLEYLDNRQIVIGTWCWFVRAASLAVSRRKAHPDYRTHLREYYQMLGIEDVYEWVNDRIMRHKAS